MDIEMLKKIYDKGTYYKRYGGSVYFFVILVFGLLMFLSFCSIYRQRNNIRNDWENQKCNPYVIPFAGYINAPANTSSMDFTLNNFTQCIQNDIKYMTEESLNPVLMVTGSLTELFVIMEECILAIVAMADYLRNQIDDIFEAIYQFFIALSVPFVQVLYGFNDILKRSNSILYIVVMLFEVFLSVLQNAYGSGMEIFIATYIVFLLIFIVLMFFLPFTMVAVVVLLILLLAMLIIIVIMATFYQTIFNGFPKYIPSTPSIQVKSSKCFCKNTLLYLKDGSQVKIKNIKVGDILEDGGIVLEKMKISAEGVDMYKLNDVIVSDTDYVSLTKNKEHNVWVQIKDHVMAIPTTYSYPYIYCLSTTTKKIIVNNMYFLDWDNITTL